MTSAPSITNPRLDSPDTFVPGVPHEAFTRLRHDAPVYRQESDLGKPFWVLSKHADIVYASQHPAVFSSAKGVILDDNVTQGGYELMMLNMDPPQHTKLRALVNMGFTPKMIRAMERHVQGIARQIVDAAVARGSFDFVTDVAAELPLQVIAEIIGIPQEDRHQIFEWSNKMVGVDDPEYGLSHEDAQAAAIGMFAYANALAEKRKDDRHDDLVSALMDAEVDGERLTPLEFNVFFLLLAVAGNETTRNLISGGMLALLEHPDQLDAVRADPPLLGTAVEEMLRWVTPVMYFRRTATQDTELRGQRIAAGEPVTLWYVSGNRDEEVFPNAGRFDVRRDPNPHITFGGGGPHFCLGYSLARLEIRLIFEELLNRIATFELTGPVARLRSNFINGTKHIPMRIAPA
jgi:cholest-4-en-3-one 26-monooxygenase